MLRHLPPMLRSAWAAVAAVLFVTAVALPASAHTQLLDITPSEGESVQDPIHVTLTFNEALIQEGTALIVTDAAGTVTDIQASFPEPHMVTADLPDLADGPTTVAWRVVSADGHPVEGLLTFTAVNTATPSASPSVEPSPEPAVTPSASPEPSHSAVVTSAPVEEPAASAGGGVPGWLWAILIVVVVGGAVYGTITVRRG